MTTSNSHHGKKSEPSGPSGFGEKIKQAIGEMFQVCCALLVAATAACLCSAHDVAVRQQLLMCKAELHFDETVSVDDVNTSYVLEVLGMSGFPFTIENSTSGQPTLTIDNMTGSECSKLKEVVQSYQEQGSECDVGVLCHVEETQKVFYAISSYKVYVELKDKLVCTGELFQEITNFAMKFKGNSLNTGFALNQDDDLYVIGFNFSYSDLQSAINIVKAFNEMAQNPHCDQGSMCYASHAEIVEAFPPLPSPILSSSSNKSGAQMLSVTFGTLLCLVGLAAA